MIALYEETANGPYPARSVKCIDEIAVESEKLRVNPFSDLMSKIFGFFKNSYPGGTRKLSSQNMNMKVEDCLTSLSAIIDNQSKIFNIIFIRNLFRN